MPVWIASDMIVSDYIWLYRLINYDIIISSVVVLYNK